MKTATLRLVVALAQASLFVGSCALAGETMSIFGYSQFTNSPPVYLNTNDVAQCVYLQLPNFGSQASLSIATTNVTGCQSGCQVTVTNSSERPVIVGPAKVTLAGVGAICTLQITRAGDSFTPSTAVVVPDDGGAPVQIIMESSTDLVTWTAALPGTYGTSTQKRFFRLRATR